MNKYVCLVMDWRSALVCCTLALIFIEHTLSHHIHHLCVIEGKIGDSVPNEYINYHFHSEHSKYAV